MKPPKPTPRRNRDGQLIGWQVKFRRAGIKESRTFSSEKLATEWAKRRTAEIESGAVTPAHVMADKTTLESVMNEYERAVTPTKKGAAQEVAKLRVLRRYAIVKKGLGALTVADFSKWQAGRLEEVAPATVNRELNTFHAIVEWARREKGIFLAQNPVRTRRPAVENARERVFRDDERARLLEVLERDDVLFLLTILALETAARQGELCALEWSDVDLDSGAMTLRRGTPGQVLRTGTKNSKVRVVPLSSLAVAAFNSMPGERVGPVVKVAQNALKMRFRRATTAAGLADFHFHDLRHIATTALIADKGLSVAEAMAITGHDSVTMAARYTHLEPRGLRARLG